MSYLIINGGRKLKGNITNQSAKNSAVALLCASVMTKGKVVLSDVPQIEEVFRILELLKSIGVVIKKLGDRKIMLDSSQPLRMKQIDKHASEATRSSLLLLGALSAREKKYKLYKSGGCKLGERTVRPHLYALEKFGVEVKSGDGFYEISNKPLKAAYLVMYESGDTATENAVMAAVMAKGVTTIKMASANYMVQDLCYFLQKAGAKIEGVGSTTLTITGVKKLSPIKDYPIMPDPIVAMTYISVAITTQSRLTVKNCPLEFLELELCKLEKMGQKYKIKNKRKSKNNKFSVADIELIPGPLFSLPDKIDGRPFPGLNIDNLPLFVPILTQAQGRTLVHDWAYENRAIYYMDLVKMGARITLLDPHRVWVEGPSEMIAKELMTPPVLRLAVDMLICMLAAKGKSILRNTYEIDRGYEGLYAVLNKAGADIKLIKEDKL
ncbi:MAG: UDP-N-acetylglucosamine 1-carboxyvinyltransferase [Candidatus Magasanikbacteria bacterium CG10_big_fil_rev_8_21_14_0_10_36_32]|uniref:UDP-N-acetylglucosamine 1-carboxyvinyltransferase n=1 Tax=Candidatus Magasanikbacteria bacterium CG10_big_fil_rev_8_21_14_0_10_36_32 TaxID=1974646 RepID=A0A2M6W646_9BACT|nr:MAG: UDP-N-acetylglucosamine 1-carboxyvinyltransferase [Candidatus Magasanikbacteria bacterium CG10_big_fil_rev_8_21_14_0_10_36_32]